jgi:hypothetical protein
MEYINYLNYLTLYIQISIFAILVINFISGFFDSPPRIIGNIIDGLIWPITIASTLGTVVRVITENIKTRNVK